MDLASIIASRASVAKYMHSSEWHYYYSSTFNLGRLFRQCVRWHGSINSNIRQGHCMKESPADVFALRCVFKSLRQMKCERRPVSVRFGAREENTRNVFNPEGGRGGGLVKSNFQNSLKMPTAVSVLQDSTIPPIGILRTIIVQLRLLRHRAIQTTSVRLL